MSRQTTARAYLLIAGVALVGCAEVPTNGQPSCEVATSLSMSTFVDASINTLQAFYSIETGFEGGTVFFQEIVAEPDRACTREATNLAYRVRLPEALRPRPNDDQVAVSWGYDGSINIFVLGAEAESVYIHGQNPLSAIINFKTDAAVSDVHAHFDSLQTQYPEADVAMLEGEPGLSPYGISVDFGQTFRGIADPTLVQKALNIHSEARARPDVEFVNLSSFGFWGDSLMGPVLGVEDEVVYLDCLRDVTIPLTLSSRTSLPLPLGKGRRYNLEECPITGWPAECEFLESTECQEAMAEL